MSDINNFRWYYNFSLTVLNLECIRREKKLENHHSFSYFSLRDDIVSKYAYTEEIVDDIMIVDYVYNDANSKITKPEWMGDVNGRLPRGAIKKLSGNVNSALSNKRNGNITKFQLKHISKKSNGVVLYEDSNFPSWIKNIDSRYWFTTKERQRKTISFKDVFNSTTKKGLEIIYDKLKDQFYLHYPVEIDYFPCTDRRSDSQREFECDKENRIIALDPGVRKFMVGYDPSGNLIYVGEGANQRLKQLMLEIDCINDGKEKQKKWRKIKNLVTELHFKAISFLLKNYDTVLLPDFRIAGMVKGKKISKMTKRLLYMFSFHIFKERILFMSKRYNKKVVIVCESFTSQTCGQCGCINRMGGSEIYKCSSCLFEADRDVNGSRNILIKNLVLR